MALPAIAATAAPYIPGAVSYVQKNAGRAYTAASEYIAKSSGKSLSAVAADALKNPSSALAVMDSFVKSGVPKNVFSAALGDTLTKEEVALIYGKLKGIDTIVEQKINSQAVNVATDPTQLAYYASLQQQVFGMLPQLKGTIDSRDSVFHGMRRVEVLRKYLEMVCDANEDAVEAFDRVRYGR